MRKFAVLNPLEGAYTYTEDETERDRLIVDIILQLYINHVHGVPYSIVEIDEDGKEHWYSPTGDEILSPKVIEEAFTVINVQMESEKTPVVTVP